MSKSKTSHRRLPPLLSVSPDGSGYTSTRFASPTPNARPSRYHKNCCQPTRYQSPGPGSYLDALLRRPSNNRKSKSSRSTNSSIRPRSQGCAQKVSEYLKKHLDFLERFVLENVSLELLERWIIRKTQRQRKQAVSNAETDEDTPSLSRWKFCVHADKREMLQELTATLLLYPNKGHVLSQLARNVAAAVNASGWHLYIYNTETKELCSFENEDKSEKSFQYGDSLATQVVKTKENIRWKSSNKDFPNAVSEIHNENAVNILCHPILQPDGELSGVLELYKDASSSEFHEEDEEIVNSYLVWGGIALHYAELFCNMIQQRELNTFLLTVVKSIFQDMVSMDTVILKIMMFARKLVSADRASLFLVDSRSGEMYARIFDINGSEEEAETAAEKKESDLCPDEIRFPIGKGIAGYVAMTGESLNIPDAYNDSRFNRAVDQRTGYNTKNILCMPIFIRGNVIGVVQMVNKVGGPFTKNDEEAFATFASYCGLALHHAKLYDKIRRSEQKHKVALEILSYHNTCCEEEIETIQSTQLPIENTALKDFNFSTELLTSDEKVVASIYMLTDLPQVGSDFKIDHDSLVRFTLTVRKNYRRVPYHNWTHGFSVANSVYTIIKESGKFRPLEELSLYVACLCHDLDHRGKTNQFLVNSSSPLAAIYSTSVLEHHHFNMTVSILQQEGHNILRNLSSAEYKKVLNNIKHCILATDLALFFPNMAKLSAIVQANKFDWNIVEHRLLLQTITMTASDLCASTKSWDQQKEIVKVIFEEFYDQGDIEKLQGRQPIPIMDRNKMDEQPASQVCFLKGICIPCYELLHTLIPQTKPMLDGCKKFAKDITDILQNNFSLSVDRIWKCGKS